MSIVFVIIYFMETFLIKNWFKTTVLFILVVIMISIFILISNNNSSSKIVSTEDIKSELPAIIKQWRTTIVKIECNWYSVDNRLVSSSYGSGILNSNAFLTNLHVLQYENQMPRECTVTFPDSTENYTVRYSGSGLFSEIGILRGWDLGLIMINNPSLYIKSITKPLNYCKNKASVGEEIVILGYPGIGSIGDLTATEGIISGYENGYYITSAKVDHGNSGGAAILVKDNCYLGVPTYVQAGELESLARILDYSKYINSLGSPVN